MTISKKNRRGIHRVSSIIGMIITIYVLLSAPSLHVEAAAGKVIFGQSASFSGGAWEPAPQFNTGLLGAFHEVNTKEGGINGRQIELVSFDDQYNVSLIAPNIEKLLAVPDVFCFVSFMGSPTTAAALPLVSAAQMPIIGPVTGSAVFRKVFNPWTINVRAGYDDEAMAMLRLFVTEKQFRRISIIYQDDDFGKPPMEAITAAMKNMKLTPTHVHKYSLTNLASVDYVQYAKEVLQYKPQGVILYCVEGFSNAFMREFFKIQTYPVSLVTGSWIGEGNRRYLQANNLDATNFYQTQVVPHPASNMNITKRYREAIYARNGTSAQFDYLSVEGYIVGRMIAEALRRTPETSDGKLNRADFLETIYNTKLFGIDELLIGPFSNDCEYDPGTAKGRSSMCQCNQGLRSVSTTRLTSTYDYVPAGVKEMIYPITECWATIDVVTRPVLVALLTNKNNSATTQRIAEGLSLDTTSHNVVVKELVASTSATAKDSFVAFSNDHLVLGGVNGMEVDYEEKYPVFPTFGAIPFQHEFHRSEIYLLATIQQQIHVACSKISAASTAPIYVVLSNTVDAMSSESGESMRSVLSNAFEIYKLSATNFLTFGTASELSQVMAEIPIAAEVLVYGVGSNELFEVLLDKMLSSQIQAYVSFDEMLVNHDIVESRFPNGTSSNVPSRLFFATNLPLWTGDSVFAGGYQQHMKAAGLGANVSNPQYFTGYFISKIMHFVLARAGEASPAAFMEELYRTSVVAVDDVSLGPFIEEQCSNEDCLCNVGPREVDLYTIAGVRERVESPIETTRFSKCRVPNAEEEMKKETSIIAIALGSVLGIVTLVLIVTGSVLLWLTFRQLPGIEYAPTNSKKPFVVVALTSTASTLTLRRAALNSNCFMLPSQIGGASVFVSRDLSSGLLLLKCLGSIVFEDDVPTASESLQEFSLTPKSPNAKLLASISFGHGTIVAGTKRNEEPRYGGRVVDTALELFDIVSNIPCRGAFLTVGEVAATAKENLGAVPSNSSNPLEVTDTGFHHLWCDDRPMFKDVGDRKFKGGIIRRISSIQMSGVSHPLGEDVQLASQRLLEQGLEHASPYSEEKPFAPESNMIDTQPAKIVTRRGSVLHVGCTHITNGSDLFRFLEMFRSIIEHFGGEIETIASTHAIATFGVHRANVLHEQNACRSALMIQEYLGTTVCIATGKITSQSIISNNSTNNMSGGEKVTMYASGEPLWSVTAMSNSLVPNSTMSPELGANHQQQQQQQKTRIFVQQDIAFATGIPSLPHDCLLLSDPTKAASPPAAGAATEVPSLHSSSPDMSATRRRSLDGTSMEGFGGAPQRKVCVVYELFTAETFPFSKAEDASIMRAAFKHLLQGNFSKAVHSIHPIQNKNPYSLRLASMAHHLMNVFGMSSAQGYARPAVGQFPAPIPDDIIGGVQFPVPSSASYSSSSQKHISPKNFEVDTSCEMDDRKGCSLHSSSSQNKNPSMPQTTSISSTPLKIESKTERSRKKREEVNEHIRSRTNNNLTTLDQGLISMFVSTQSNDELEGSTDRMTNGSCSISDLELPMTFQDVSGVKWTRSANPISSGAFAVVYRAISARGKVVSIKCLDTQSSSSAAPISSEDIANEVSTLSSYAHENIIGYITYGFVGRYCCIIMEHAGEGSLHTAMKDFGPLPIETARNYFREALRGLEYLHSHNVIHCDVKPHNILIGSDGICKIADFGSTVDLHFGNSTTEKLARGTPGYMAPEACRGSETAAGDIYGIGISMIELLTGELPWGKMGNLNHFIARLGKDATLEPKIPDSFDKNLREVVAAMLQREPENRPSASDILQFPFFTEVGFEDDTAHAF